MENRELVTLYWKYLRMVVKMEEEDISQELLKWDRLAMSFAQTYSKMPHLPRKSIVAAILDDISEHWDESERYASPHETPEGQRL